MGLLDEWSRRATARRREGKIEFLGEQSGAAEDTFKRALLLELVTRPGVKRAYLAQAKLDAEGAPSTTLAVVMDGGDEHGLVRRVGEIVSRTMSREATLDVVFLTAEQEADLRATCAPFYGR